MSDTVAEQAGVAAAAPAPPPHRARFLGVSSRVLIAVLLVVVAVSTAGQVNRTRKLLAGFRTVSRGLRSRLKEALFADDDEAAADDAGGEELGPLDEDGPPDEEELRSLGAGSVDGGGGAGNWFDAMLDAFGAGDEGDVDDGADAEAVAADDADPYAPDAASDADTGASAATNGDGAVAAASDSGGGAGESSSSGGDDGTSAADAVDDPLEAELRQAAADGGWDAPDVDVPWRFDPSAPQEEEEEEAAAGGDGDEVSDSSSVPATAGAPARGSGGGAAPSPRRSRSAARTPRPTRSRSRSASKTARPTGSRTRSPSKHASPSRSPSREPTPSRSRTPSPARYPRKRPDRRPLAARYRCPAGRKYLHLLSTREGMSAWTHIVFEALSMAQTLGRALVEPCVAGGLLLPCRPGRVLPVPEGLADTDYPITADDDPLAVPAFKEHCGAGRGSSVPRRVVLQKGRSYPLSLYMNLPRLRKLHRGAEIVSFDEWAECELRRRRRASDRDAVWSGGHVRAPRAYCLSMRAGGSNPFMSACDRRVVGRYAFKTVWRPHDTPELAALPASSPLRQPGAGHVSAFYRSELEGDGSRNMFLFEVWRGFWRPYGTFRRVPSFNAIHSRAVGAWVRSRLGARSPRDYAVFNWRSEGVPDSRMPKCARALAARAAPALAALRRTRKAGGVLVADVPAPESPCRLWHTYAGSAAEGGARRVALETLADAGLAKYDGDHPGLDAGVLSIRDWLLAVQARWYVTCHAGGDKGGAGTGGGSVTDDECRGCFRGRSKYVARILAARAKAGRASFTRWFRLTPSALGAGG
jgi:hypothetical protein